MYIPKAFREDDIDTLHAFMREYSFAILVTRRNGDLLASHLPFLLDTERGRDKSGPYGALIAHMARANPRQNRSTNDQARVVAALEANAEDRDKSGPYGRLAELMSKRRKNEVG